MSVPRPADAPPRRRIVLWVVGAHLILILALIIVPLVRRWFRPRPPRIIPIELAMTFPAPDAAIPPPPAPVQAPAPTPARPPRPAVTNQPPPAPEPETPPPRQRPAIAISQDRVVRTRDPAPTPPAPTPPRPALTEDQLRRLLEGTLGTGAPTTAPISSDTVDLELIRQTLYQAWRQPGGRHLRGRITEVSLRLDAQGTIVEYRIVRASGDDQMDASVRGAMDGVKRIPGLSPGFPARRPWVSIYFEVVD